MILLAPTMPVRVLRSIFHTTMASTLPAVRSSRRRAYPGRAFLLNREADRSLSTYIVGSGHPLVAHRALMSASWRPTPWASSSSSWLILAYPAGLLGVVVPIPQ